MNMLKDSYTVKQIAFIKTGRILRSKGSENLKYML